MEDEEFEAEYFTFGITKSQHEKISVWLKNTVYPEVIKYQKKNTKNPTIFHKDSWKDGYPYEGAIGGGLSYEITPTSIGVITCAVYTIGFEKDKKEWKYDLTDYDSW